MNMPSCRPWNHLGLMGCWEVREDATYPGQVIGHAHVTGCGSEGSVAKRYLATVFNRSNWTLSCEFQKQQQKLHPLDPSIGGNDDMAIMLAYPRVRWVCDQAIGDSAADG